MDGWLPGRPGCCRCCRAVATQAANLERLTGTLVVFDVEEKALDSLAAAHPRLQVVHAQVTRIDSDARVVHTVSPAAEPASRLNDAAIAYDKLCICTGARPRLVVDHPLVLGLRDAMVRPCSRRLRLQGRTKCRRVR